MKVLHFHASGLFGGVETFLITIARYQSRFPDVQHVFGLCFDDRLANSLREENAQVEIVPPSRLRNPFSVFGTRAALRRLIAAHRPDAAVCHMSKSYYLLASALRKAGVPVVYYMHGPMHGKLDPYDRLSKRTGAPDLLIGVSNHTTEMGKALLFPDAVGTTINYPMPRPTSLYQIDPAARVALRVELDTVESDVLIFQAARMNAWKGQPDLLSALALLKDEPGWVLWMAGGAQAPEEVVYEQSLKDQAAALGIMDRVRFLGDRNDVARLLSAADIYCQANTQSEGFSLSFTEAFSAGLPIVTTDCGSASEMINTETGILTPVHDAPALAAALRSLIRDKDCRLRMGQAAIRRIEMLSDPERQLGRLNAELARLVRTR